MLQKGRKGVSGARAYKRQVIGLSRVDKRTMAITRVGKFGIVTLRSFFKCLYGHVCISLCISENGRDRSGHAVDASASSVLYALLESIIT